MLLSLLLAAAEPESVPVRVSPAMQLALDVAERVGATVQRLAVHGDASVSEQDRVAVENALRATSLFEIDAGGVVLQLTRPERGAMLGSVERDDGTRLAVVRAVWAIAADADGPAASADEVYERVRTYRRQRLWVQQQTRTEHLRLQPVPLHVEPRSWFERHDAGPVVSSTGWVIRRGDAETIDESTFARLIGDESLLQAIVEQRGAVRSSYTTFFGGLGLASAMAGGAWLWLGHDGRDERQLAYASVGLGVACGIIAAIIALSDSSTRFQSASEAEVRADAYNARLRAELGITAADLAAYPPEY